MSTVSIKTKGFQQKLFFIQMLVGLLLNINNNATNKFEHFVSATGKHIFNHVLDRINLSQVLIS